uniref:Uncharacterized protein n=1 Tax=Arundo donax TaxID=35708 RepID=A0A0A8XX35_ARUDO
MVCDSASFSSYFGMHSCRHKFCEKSISQCAERVNNIYNEKHFQMNLREKWHQNFIKNF